MPEALFFEFTGVSAADYRAVNAILELDPSTGDGAWPLGLITRTGAAGNNGSFVVFKVWESHDTQSAWMTTRLGPARSGPGYPNLSGSSGSLSRATMLNESSLNESAVPRPTCAEAL